MRRSSGGSSSKSSGGSGSGGGGETATSTAMTAPGTATTATGPGVTSARPTATFEPYFWEAYNEIVRPDRYDWYLITRWLPDLGPEGLTLLKVLRNQCYWNPREGTLRDVCQMTVDELAELCGMTRSTVYRVLEKNEALRHFVQRQPDAVHIEGRTRRLPPRWRVCMDTPIHPDDLPAYDLLRARREGDRRESEEERRKSQIEIYEKRKSQIGIYEKRKSQNGERKSQNAGRKSQIGILKGIDSIPSGGNIPTDPIPPGAGGSRASRDEIPPKNSPQGEEGEGRHGSAVPANPVATTLPFDALPEAQPKAQQPEEEAASVAEALQESLLCGAWQQALRTLATVVNKPTFEGHLKPLQAVALDEATGTVELSCPSAFTREWLDKRHRDAIEIALADALGRPVTVRLTADTGAKRAEEGAGR